MSLDLNSESALGIPTAHDAALDADVILCAQVPRVKAAVPDMRRGGRRPARPRAPISVD